MRAILTFHGVDSSGSVLSVSGSQLASLVGAIRASGHEIVPLCDLLDGASTTRDAVALTFDDGVVSVAEAGAPMLEDLGAPATLFLTTGRVGLDNGWPSQPPAVRRLPMMTWRQIEGLHAKGWAIEAHSVTHPDLRTLSADALDDELGRPVDDIRRRIGVAPTVLAYPYGAHDRRVEEHAGRHYRHAVTTAFRPLRREEAPHRVPRLDACYLRTPTVHRWFGGGVAFRVYLAARGFLRTLERRT